MDIADFRATEKAYYPLAKKKLIQCKKTGAMVKKPEFIYHPVDPTKPEYIGTWVQNPTGTQTVLTMTMDMDFTRSDRAWMIQDKDRYRLDYYKAMDWLREQHPILAQYLLHCCESTGHQGFSWEFAISPLTLNEDDPTLDEVNRRSIWLFNMVRIYLIALFRHHGLGCDPSTVGLKRLTMNWRNPEFHIYTNSELHKNVWNRSCRTNVLRQLFDYLKELPEIKKGAWERWLDDDWTLEDIYPDRRCRSKIARLIVDIADDGYTISTDAQTLMVEYGLSKRVVYDVIRKNKFPQKMGITVDANHGDWTITIDMASEALGLAYAELESPKTSSKSFKLCAPEDVEDGQRYRWLGQAIVYLKYAGIDRASAYQWMLRVVERIPGHESSRNCQASELLSKVRCIYKREPKADEIHPEILPHFLNPEKPIEGSSNLVLRSKSELEIPLNPKKVYCSSELDGCGEGRETFNKDLNKPISRQPEKIPCKKPVVTGLLREDGGLPSTSEDEVVCKAVGNPSGELCSPQVVHGLVPILAPSDRSQENSEVCKDREGGAGETMARQNTTYLSEAQIANTSHVKNWGNIVLAAFRMKAKATSLRLGFSHILNRSRWPFPDADICEDGKRLLRKFKQLEEKLLMEDSS